MLFTEDMKNPTNYESYEYATYKVTSFTVCVYLAECCHNNNNTPVELE